MSIEMDVDYFLVYYITNWFATCRIVFFFVSCVSIRWNLQFSLLISFVNLSLVGIDYCALLYCDFSFSNFC